MAALRAAADRRQGPSLEADTAELGDQPQVVLPGDDQVVAAGLQDDLRIGGLITTGMSPPPR